MSIGIPRIKDGNTETLTDNPTVLTAASAYHQRIDSDGAKDVDMPSGTGTQGGECMITNTGGETITVKQSDSSTTIIAIAAGESALLLCNGLSAANGWQASQIAAT